MVFWRLAAVTACAIQIAFPASYALATNTPFGYEGDTFGVARQHGESLEVAAIDYGSRSKNASKSSSRRTDLTRVCTALIRQT